MRMDEKNTGAIHAMERSDNIISLLMAPGEMPDSGQNLKEVFI